MNLTGIASQKKIKVVDLFSGVGGLTFGFYYRIKSNQFIKNDAFEIVFANDNDVSASTAFAENFPDITMLNISIENLDEKYFKEKGIDYTDIDLIIGGPPCQSYSMIGKRKNDERSKMYTEYKRLLTIIKPKVFIFENVLGILSFKKEDGTKIIDNIITEFNDIGYNIDMKVLNSVDYGIPQNRQRVFIVGTRKDTNINWIFPPSILSNLTLEDAISDLPAIEQGEKNEQYEFLPSNDYQKLLRSCQTILLNHWCGKHGERINKIIENLSEGESRDDINKKVTEGVLPNELFLTSGYNNSYGRLIWNKPSGTITNNFSTPSAIRCIHPNQNRALSPREAARIQSFPDWFKFTGNKAQINRQIGNAVPPLLAIELAKQVEVILNDTNK